MFILALVLFLGGFIGLFFGRWMADEDGVSKVTPTLIASVFMLAGVILGLLSVLLVVQPTHGAVLKNTRTGTARYVGPGWQFKHPVFEKATRYDLRFREFKIGEENTVAQDGTVIEKRAIDAASNSPGLPIVYLVVTARVRPSSANCPGQECNLTKIELEYGLMAWEELIKDRMFMNTREVAGRNPYNYVGTNRDGFAQDILDELEVDLEGLADFAYLGIEWYDFSTETNRQLDLVAERERELERATQNVEIAIKEKEKERVVQEQAVMVAEKQAEAAVLRAEGERQATVLSAQGQAESLLLTSKAEAEGLRLLNETLRQAPDLTEYKKWAVQWDGTLPRTILGDSGVLLEMDLP